MALPKFLVQVGGFFQEVYATATGGIANANKIVSLDNNGLLSQSMFPAGVGDDITVVVASENLAAGDFVNLWVNAGALNARKADASTTGKYAHGFVLQGFTAGSSAQVFRRGQNTAITGVAPGDIFLSDVTPGRTTSTPVTGTGKTSQRLGTAVSSTLIDVSIEQPIQLV